MNRAPVYVLVVFLSILAVNSRIIGSEIDVVSNESPGVDVREFIKLESEFRELLQRTNFLIAIGDWEYFSKQDQNKARLWSSSAFAASSGKDKAGFMITAGHAFMNFNPNPQVVVFFPKNPANLHLIPIQEINKYSSGMLDVAAYPFDENMKSLLTPMSFGNVSTLELYQPLAIFCSPLKFLEPVRVGFFSGIIRGVGHEYLLIKFSGIGAANYCSGAPVVDREGKIYGMLVRADDHTGYAVPANIIEEFLDEKYFKK